MRLSHLGPLLIALSVTLPTPLCAQAPAPPDSGQMTIHVNVSARNGDPVEGLTKDDFTLTDNKHSEPITSLRALTGAQTGIVIVLDAVNLPYTEVSFARQQLTQFFSSNPHLPQPTTLGVLLSDGLKMQPEFTTDGNAIGRVGFLPRVSAPMHVHSSAGYSAQECVDQAGLRPGR